MQKFKTYILHVLIGIDQLLNTLFAGWPDETISSRLYRADMDGLIVGKIIRPALDKFIYFISGQQNHCRESFLSERCDRQQHPEDRYPI